jgi:DUF4097 and DUF4098 domain-containing protein YvlB
MPAFATPHPIDLAINLQVGRIDVTASDRTDTVVTVTASSSRSNDRRGVDETTITFDDDRLSIVGPKPKLSWIGPNSGDAVDIVVDLPTGSRLTAEIAVGNVRTTGRLGATRIKSATGSVNLDATGDLWVRASHGPATIGTADGGVDITTSYGQITIGTVSGDALLQSSYGNIQIGESGGGLEAKLSYGDLDITTALGSVTAKTAFGGIGVAEVSSGSIDLESGFGQLGVGVRSGVAAWLDLSSKDGRVRNDLDSETMPDPSEQTVTVRARTGSGDIIIQRAR